MGAKLACGNSRASWATRLTLPVPSVGASPNSPANSLTASNSRDRDSGRTTASSGSSRGSTPPITRPSGSTTGMSLLLCTARSMSRPSSASSISLTNSRLPPASESGASSIRSPDVLMTMMRQRGPPAAEILDATARACQRASWLPRVPRRSSCTGPALSAARRASNRVNGSTRPRPGVPAPSLPSDSACSEPSDASSARPEPRPKSLMRASEYWPTV